MDAIAPTATVADAGGVLGRAGLAAESAAEWSRLPAGMEVHRYGALAVPRNAYLRPEAVVEDLADHRREVRARVHERVTAYRDRGEVELTDAEPGHYVATALTVPSPGKWTLRILVRTTDIDEDTIDVPVKIR